MSRYVTVFIIFTVSYQCDGQLGKIADAVLSAHKHVHDTVHSVASSVVGGFTGGFNLNFGVHSDMKPATGLFNAFNPFRRPQNEQSQQLPPEKQPPQENYYNQQQTHQNDYGNQQGQNEIHQDISTPSNQHHNQPSSENKPVHQNDADDQFHRPEQQNNPYQERDRDVKKPTEIPNDDKKPMFGTTTHTNEPVPTDEPRTNKSDSDAPLFVPLSPDEYKYEGDKIEVNAPKRDTDKAPEYDIDIRFRDE